MPHPLLYWSFVAITLVVTARVLWLVQLAYAHEHNVRFHLKAALTAGLVLTGWLVVHGMLARSGILLGPPDQMPPRAFPYLAVTTGAVVAVACSPVGRTMAKHISWPALIGLQAFRTPLEVWLHQMWTHGQIPQQMTWSGWNFDIISGITALAVAVIVTRKHAPRLILAWNILGLTLLFVVVSIAFMSAPTPIKQFDGPALMLIFEAPFNWIATVLVMTALFGHIVVFRKLKHDATQ